jgi:hypothetical protein
MEPVDAKNFPVARSGANIAPVMRAAIATLDSYDWLKDFYGVDDDGGKQDKEHDRNPPTTPPATPEADKPLLQAIAEGGGGGGERGTPRGRLSEHLYPARAIPPVAVASRLVRVPTAPARQRFVGHAPATVSEITVAQRNYYSNAQQAWYSGAPHGGLAVLATAAAVSSSTGDNKAGKKKKKLRPLSDKTKTTAARFVTTKHGQIVKIAGKKKKTTHKKRKNKNRNLLSHSWPGAGRSAHDDDDDRRAERAEMERFDRK